MSRPTPPALMAGLVNRLAVRPYPGLRLGNIDLPGLPRTTAIEKALRLPVRLQLAARGRLQAPVPADGMARCKDGTGFKSIENPL